MQVRTKIRPDLIDQAHRTLDALPQHQPEELTKTQAVQKLIAPIRAAQSKGYSLAAIGKVLSDCGIPITTGALRAYVSGASTSAGGKKKRKPKPSAAKAATSPQTPALKRAPQAATAPAVAPARKPGGVASPRNVDHDWDPAARSEKYPPSKKDAYAGFDVREDTKDI